MRNPSTSYRLTVRIDVAPPSVTADMAAVDVAAARLAEKLPGGVVVATATVPAGSPAVHAVHAVTVTIMFRHDGDLQTARTAAAARMFDLNSVAPAVARAAGGQVAGTRVVKVEPDPDAAPAWS